MTSLYVHINVCTVCLITVINYSAGIMCALCILWWGRRKRGSQYHIQKRRQKHVLIIMYYWQYLTIGILQNYMALYNIAIDLSMSPNMYLKLISVKYCCHNHLYKSVSCTKKLHCTQKYYFLYKCVLNKFDDYFMTLILSVVLHTTKLV